MSLSAQFVKRLNMIRGKNLGLLQPHPTLDAPWQSNSMDFIFGFPKSIQGNIGIWTIVD